MYVYSSSNIYMILSNYRFLINIILILIISTQFHVIKKAWLKSHTKAVSI